MRSSSRKIGRLGWNSLRRNWLLCRKFRGISIVSCRGDRSNIRGRKREGRRGENRRKNIEST